MRNLSSGDRVDASVINRNVYFLKTLVSIWNNFKQGYSESRIASGGHFFFKIK